MNRSVVSAFRRNVTVAAAAIVLGATGAYAQGNGDTAGVAKARSAYEKAAGAQDAAGIAKLYTADGMEMPPNAPAAKGLSLIHISEPTRPY